MVFETFWSKCVRIKTSPSWEMVNLAHLFEWAAGEVHSEAGNNRKNFSLISNTTPSTLTNLWSLCQRAILDRQSLGYKIFRIQLATRSKKACDLLSLVETLHSPAIILYLRTYKKNDLLASAKQCVQFLTLTIQKNMNSCETGWGHSF